MARLPTYVASESSQTGAVGVQASEAAFGGGQAATGALAVAQGLFTAADVIEKRKDQEGAIWTNRAVTQAQQYWLDDLEKRKNSAPPGAPDFTPNLAKDYDKFVQDQLKAAPTGATEAMLSEHLNQLGSHLQTQAMHFEASQRVLKMQNDIETSNNSAEAIVVRNPSMLDAMIAQQTKAVNEGAAGRLPRDSVTKLRNGATSQLYISALDGYAANDNPEMGLKLLRDKKYDSFMDGRARAGMEERFNRMIEQNLLRDRAAILGAHQSNLDQIDKFGKPDPNAPSPGILKKIAPRAAQEIQMAYQRFHGTQAIQNKPLDEAAKVLAEAQQKPVLEKTSSSLPVELLDYIKEKEGFTPTAQPDGGQLSVGYGTRAKASGETLTKAQADARLQEELSTHYLRVQEAAQKKGLDLNPNQLAALTSFDFNTGQGVQTINKASDLEDLKSKIADYPATSNGKPMVGLVNRRKSDVALFDKPFDRGSQIDPNTGGPMSSSLNGHEQGEVYDHLVKVYQHEAELRQKDPAGASDRAPEILAIRNELASTKDPIQQQTLQKKLFDTRLAWQKAVGIPSWDQMVVSLDEAKGIADALNKAPPAQKQSVFMQAQQTYGEHYGELMSALQRLPEASRPSGQYIMLGLKADSVEGKRLATAIGTPKTVLEEGMTPMKITELKNSLASQPDIVNLKQALYSAGGERAQLFSDMLGGMESYSKMLLKEGIAANSKEAASKAVAHLISNEFSFGDSPSGKKYIIPLKDASGRTWQPTDIQRMKSRLDISKVRPTETLAEDVYGGFFPGLTFEHYKPRMEEAIRSRSTWVNNGKNDGVELYVDITGEGNYLQVLDKEHKPVYRNFKELATTPYLEAR